MLNRLPNHDNKADTVHVMKYIFPRQFGLHNVFTSVVDSKETSQPFKDYTLREEEIAKADRPRNIMSLSTAHLPKRLRGRAFDLVRRLQILHKRCSYTQLLNHYCPPVSSDIESFECHSNLCFQFKPIPMTASSTVDAATMGVQVSAFVRAIVSHVWPRDLFGSDEDGERNWRLLMTNIHTFIVARRYETISLDNVMRGMKVCQCQPICQISQY